MTGWQFKRWTMGTETNISEAIRSQCFSFATDQSVIISVSLRPCLNHFLFNSCLLPIKIITNRNKMHLFYILRDCNRSRICIYPLLNTFIQDQNINRWMIQIKGKYVSNPVIKINLLNWMYDKYFKFWWRPNWSSEVNEAFEACLIKSL